MYRANKIETFHPAKGRIDKTEDAIRMSFRSHSVHRLKLLIFCLLFAINAALPSKGLAVIKVEPGTTVQVGEEVFFDGTGVTIAGAALLDNGMVNGSYEWDFGDDYTVKNGCPYPWSNNGGTSVSHFYTRAGTYTVSLNATDVNGKNKIETISITVIGQDLKLPPRPSIEPILELKFENNLQDTSGSGLTAQWQGTGSFLRGIEGRAADLSNGSYIEVLDPNSILSGMNELTISLWARKKDANADGYLLDKNGVYNTRLTFGSGKAGLNGSITTQSSTATVSRWPAYEIVDEAWHHYVITYNGSLVRLFVDGIENIYGNQAPKDSTGAVQTSANNLLIGKKFDNATVFNGYIDEIKIYNKALTLKEVSIGFELWHADFHGRIAQYIYAQIPGEFTKDPTNKIKATITGDNGYSKIIYQKNDLQSEEKVLLNNSELPAGKYSLTVQILDATNSVLEELTEKFSKPYDGMPKFSIDENNAIRVNGVLFFPVTPWILGAGGISTWSSYINVLFGESWKQTPTVSTWQTYLDDANTNNLQVIGPAIFERGSLLHRNANMNSLTEYVNTTKNHNELCMWVWKDEPVSVKGVSPAVVRSWTYKTQSLDPTHLVGTTYELGSWIRGPLENTVDYSTWTLRRGGVDYKYNAKWFGGKRTNIVNVASVDWYPIAYQNLRASDPPFTQPFERVDGYALGLDRFIEENYDLVPCMAWVETCSIGGLAPPTPAQLKMLIWLNIVHGSKGINWFHYSGVTPPENFAVMAEFLDHITQLTPVVLGPKTSRTVTDNANTGGNRVDTMVREYGNDIYIFAVRLTEVPEAGDPPTTVTFNVEGIDNAIATVFDEGRTLDISSGSFQDTFVSNAVHIYKMPLSVETHTLSVNAQNGSVTKTPNKVNYNHGESVTLQAVANTGTGYDFVNWSGDASGSSNPTTIVMDAEKSVTANFAINTYTITASANGGGTIDPNGTTQVVPGSSQTCTITPSGEHHIFDVVVDGSSVGDVNSYNFQNITADHTITATFAITITASAGSGGQISPSGITQVVSGGSQTYNITANAGYHISDVLVDGSSVGAVTSNSFTNVIADHTIAATFAINTYTISASAGSNGTISPSGTTQVASGGSQTYTITANSGYDISDVVVDGSSVGKVSSYPFTNVTANHTIAAIFAEQDVIDPIVTNLNPQADSIQAPLNTLVILDITDSGDGVDAASVTIKVNYSTVYKGDTTDYNSVSGHCYRIGTNANYRFIYQSEKNFEFDQPVSVDVNATDLAGNSMDTYSYSFKTEMRSFGENKMINSSSDRLNKGSPVTVRDNGGNIWAAWHAGVAGSRDIYVGKLAAGADNFGNSIIIRDNPADQCNPVIAVDSDDKLYVAWQDNRRGEWDIYVSTSTDGTNWSTEMKITDPNSNKTNPAMVIDSSNKAYIVWEDDRNGNGNKDIYVADSSDSFSMKTPITSDPCDQLEPAIAADSDNTIYVVWTDTRNFGKTGFGKNDIYGAASDESWTNIPVVTAGDSQSNPAIATESEGSILHLIWVDDRLGDNDIFYDKTTDGLSPLTGSSIIDDSTGADQLNPVVAVTGSTTGNNLQIFACWQDERDADDDLYFVEISSGNKTNVFVDDDGTNTDQTEPAIGIDVNDHPYLVWTDNRNTNTDIYYAGSTYIEPDILASENVSMSLGATVGTYPPKNVDDVSVVVPAGAYPCDIEITISKITNPLAFGMPCLGAYDFGPSGIEFIQPVTVTIPYNATESATVAYWYNSLTDALSQQGITNVETIISLSNPNVHALRFETTHFTPFYVFLVSAGGAAASGGGGGGGGCSMSPNSQASIVELLLPYIGLTVTMVALKLKDRRKKKAHNIT